MPWTIQDLPRLDGRVALVTGANSGLGFHTCGALAGAGARVFMACRDMGKAEAAAAQIRSRHPQADLRLCQLDLAALDSVAECARSIREQLDALDLLINNAGIMAVPHGLTQDGFEMQIGTNHFGHFALTAQLLPVLRAASAARIVNVASLAHHWSPGLDFSDLDWTRRKYKRWQAYGDSKLANLYFSYELSRRLEGQGLRVVAAHPGYADTHLQYVAAEQKHSALEKATMWLGNTLFAQSAAMGALPSLYAATHDAVRSGDFIGPDGFRQTRGYPRKVRSNRRSHDAQVAARLWEVSEQRTGVGFAVST